MIIASTWVLAVVARPYQWWKVALVALSVLAYLLIFSWPLTQSLFLLDTGNAEAMRTGLVAGLVGAVLIELAWWLRGRLFGEPVRVWQTASADEA